jgi:catechol-2,3-dioxygenase
MQTTKIEPSPVTGIAHLLLDVSDVDASAAWYTSVLGFEETMRQPGRLVSLSSPSGQWSLVLRAGGHPDNQGAVNHIAFSVPSLDALTAWVAHLTALGIAHQGIESNPGVGHTVDLMDPDGNKMELVSEA